MSRRFGPWPIVTLLLCLALAQAPAAAADPGAEICERAIVAGARAVGVPQEVLHAISLTETGRPDGGRLRPWPWAINREGQGHWFKSRAEAFAFAQASLAAGRRSFDVGCFQINYHWHGHNFPSLETMFDPEAGATYAARFLQEPLPRARQLARRRRRLPLADAGPRQRLPRPLRAHPRRPRRQHRPGRRRRQPGARPPTRRRRRARAAPACRAARRSSPSRRSRPRRRPAAPPRRS